MLKLRTPRLKVRRSLPQRNEQLNNSLHRIHVSPRQIRRVGFNSSAILADAQISGWVFSHWSKKALANINRVIKRHVFGFFVISLTALQILPVTTDETLANKTIEDRPLEYTLEDSVKASPAPVFQRPMEGSLSQGYWYIHPAIDIPNQQGSKINPIEEGVTTYAGWDGGYGYTVVIKHKADFSSRYAHLSTINVKVGSRVTKTTTIGSVGATGYATGSHLHLEVYDEGSAVDPQKYLPVN
jgi:murein DD-endopeptidase MepM/ murein hydrolase activator NlpD